MLLRQHLICLMSIVLILPYVQRVHTQRTALDDVLGQLFRLVKRVALPVLGRTSEEPQLVQRMRNTQRTQHKSKRLTTLKALCAASGSASARPRRSGQRPRSVHRLRPGDIDIVGAMGDSLAAGNAMYGSNVLQIFIENRGRSAVGGGQGTWRDQLTIPNILKEFNPHLYGYSLRDGLSTDRSSKFNVAEPGAMSRDMPFMARVLAKRMRRDPRVNMTGDWKLVSYLIGANDFCADMCYYDDYEGMLRRHERDLVKSLRYLRDHVPRLMVNLISPPNMQIYRDFDGLPPHCRFFRVAYCPCQMGNGRTQSQLAYHDAIMERWLALDKEVANREEFNTDTFTVNVLPALELKTFPQTRNGKKSLDLLAEDCFHWTAYGQAVASNAFWNNMLERPGEQSFLNPKTFGQFRCPTEQRPYLVTRVNRHADFQL